MYNIAMCLDWVVKQASPEPMQSLSSFSQLYELATLLNTSPPDSIIDLGGRILSGDLPLAAGDVLTVASPGMTLRNGKLRLTGSAAHDHF